MVKKTLLAGIIIFLFIFTAISWNAGQSAEPITPTPTVSKDSDHRIYQELELAVLEEILSSPDYGVGMPGYGIELDNIRISQDGTYAVGWITRVDIETSETLPGEPGTFVGEKVRNSWLIHLPVHESWSEAIRGTENELITLDEKNRLLGTNTQLNQTAGIEADDGYLLPWAEGVPVYLSRSVSHDEDIPSGNAHYSFDFFIPQTMFNLYASKAGTVWAFKDTVPNNDHSDVNFIVLRNADNPNLYQLYLHLAQNSIPPSLKSIGAQVIQGQFVGVADNTGASTGHHLHFQVQSQPYWPVDNPYWGVSVDITFDDVSIYGGRPRRAFEYDSEICGGYCEDGLQTYVSANMLKGDLIPPIGDFSGVDMGQVVVSNNLYLSGWASDADSGLYSGQLRALYDGSWHNLGSQFNNTFSYTWDLCSPDNPIPEGVVSLGLRLYDWDGNWADYAGLKHFINKSGCSQIYPTCIPTAHQIALFEDVDYSGGCVLLDIGEYPSAQSMGTLGDNDAASIRVGANVQASLYSQDDYAGHSETILGADNNFSDNLIGIDTLSSVMVGERSANPGAPVVLNPSSGSNFLDVDLIPLSWMNGGNSVEYQVSYSLNGGASVNLSWMSQPYRYLGSMAPGDYTWRVRGRNAAGVVGAWSQEGEFQVSQAPALPPAIIAPFTDDMENNEAVWTSSGMWTLKNDSDMSRSGIHAWWYQGTDGDYDNSTVNYGSLTTPPINIPSDGYFLRFWYRYETESNKNYWDQRWVQISIDGSAFTNLYNLVDDPQIPETPSWLQSAAIDLSAFSGHSVQFRFQFTTWDNELNSFQGWGIDDFSITNTPPSICEDNRQDETPSDAVEISYSEIEKHPAEICPGGDYDFYRFTGLAEERIVIDVDAQSDGSPLDSYLHLIDSDGVTILAEHDDEVYGNIRDPLLSYTLPHDGNYYIKVRAWKHPHVGGDEDEYTIRLYRDNQDPFTSILSPQSGTYIPVEPFSLIVQAVDALDGVGHVDFFWHDYDWVIPSWELFGSDWEVSDGWSTTFNPEGLLERDGGAFYVNTYDKAGNWAGAGVWNIGVDLTPPTSNLLPLSATQDSTAFLLTWNGSDNASGIDYVNLQFNLDGGNWQTHPDEVHSKQYWFIGNAGQNYNFRIRGVDNAGNLESYPTDTEAATAIPDAEEICASPDLYDMGNGDNSHDFASVINPAGGAQVHNYCNPQAPDRLYDEDWLRFNAQINDRYLIQALPFVGNAAVIMELYASDGTTLLTQGSSSSFGRPATINWVSDRDGEVFLRLRHLDGRVIGDQVLYEIRVNQGFLMYIPLLNK